MRRAPATTSWPRAWAASCRINGDPSTPPQKVAVAVTDIICGIYSVVGILAALQHRHLTGRGQQVDLALLDTQVSWLANVGLQYLTSGVIPKQFGNEHPSIVPYSVVPCSDGYFILAIGNDRQFAQFAKFAGKPEWAEDERFKTNPARVRNRVECYRADPRGDVAEAAASLGRRI